MFDRSSRYANVLGFTAAGFPGTRPRPIPITPGVIEHTLTRDDRLDRMAVHYYNDPHKWWLILDANPEIAYGGDLDMGEYAGTVIVIPAATRGGRGR